MYQLKQIHNWLKESQAMIILTGAGMGVDSGMVDFRSAGGRWGQVEKDTNLTALEVSNPKYLEENPKYVWRMLATRMQEYKNTTPHLGFQILKKWINDFDLDYFTITSNVDEHFQIAGFDDQKHRELHGNMFYMQCNKPCSKKIWRYNFEIEQVLKEVENEKYPRCPDCGNLIRPNVYMFRDYAYISTRDDEQKSRFLKFLAKNKENKIIVFEIGSGPHVQSIRKNTRMLIREYNAKVVRINPNDFKIKEPHIGIAKGALEALMEIDEFIDNIKFF